jgi:ligand-binding sensor domain-containing protein/signal transduction histidine kinase
MNNCRILVLILLQFISILAFSQNKQIRFERIGIREGLSDPIVLCMMQDSRGFIWVGTRRGLNRYDGHQFKVFLTNMQDSTSISGNYINKIIEDSKGYIWIATANGLSRFDRRKNTFRQYFSNPANPNSLSNSHINTIIEDKTGKLWVGTSEGVNLFDPVKNLFSHFIHKQNEKSSISDNYITSLYTDSKGDIWVGTQSGGLNKFNPLDNSFTNYTSDPKNIYSISGNKINAIFEDSRNQLWIGTDDGLNLLDRETNRFQKFRNIPNINSLSGNNILSINEDDNRNLLIGVENGGINLLDSSRQNFTNYKNDEIDENSLSANSVYSILKDNAGSIWVGVFAGGINLYLKNSANFNHYKHNSSKGSLSNNFVLCLYEDDYENLWIGTDGGGLNCYNKRTGEYEVYKTKSGTNRICGDYVITVTGDHKDNLWIGTWGNGLSKFNLKTKKFTNFKSGVGNRGPSGNNIYSIKVAKDGKIWIGTFGDGLDIYDEKTNTFINYKNKINDPTSLGNDKIYDILEDRSCRIWIATAEGGINLYEPKTNSFSRFFIENNKMNSNTSYCLLETANGKIYAGTIGDGLEYFDEAANRFVSLESRDKFSSEFVYAALEDKLGNIWISSNKGISMYDPNNKIVKNYSAEDGLQADEFKPHSAFRTKSGMLYFGGINGYNSFYPGQIRDKTYNPSIVLTDFQLFNKSVPIAQSEKDLSPLKQDISETKSLSLKYNQSVFSFVFASLDYSVRDKKNYAYKLEGFDKDWNYVVNKNSATYTNLNHGDYVFKVKSQNNLGEWSPNICTINLTIVPPFWLTWWFKILMGLILVIIPVGFSYWRINQLRHQKELLEKSVNERTNEIHSKNEQLNQQALILIQRNDQLKDLNSTKDKLFSIISHDLRSPFNAILGFQELLLDNYENFSDDDRLNMIKQAQSTTNQTYFLVDNLLDWAKIQTNNIQYYPIQIDLEKVIIQIFELYRNIAEIKKISLHYNLPDKLIAFADNNLLETTLRNLINNAIKFSLTGGSIKVTANKRNDHLIISVSDSGTGMTKTQIENLFNLEKPQTISGTNGEKGSGLGLLLCKEFIEKNKGTLSVESLLGKGSTFSFTIPGVPQK